MELNLDLNDLSLDNLVRQSTQVKIVSIVVLCMLLLGIAYWFDTSHQLNGLVALKQSELELRQKLEEKQDQLVNLEKYREQLKTIQTTFARLLRQFPKKTEVPGLLEDISETGISSGLEFALFDPDNEINHEFYAELPIKMAVRGTYQELATFVSQLAALDRIVTLHDITIKHTDKKDANNNSSKKESAKKGDPELLHMDMTAKTYRHLESEDKLK